MVLFTLLMTLFMLFMAAFTLFMTEKKITSQSDQAADSSSNCIFQSIFSCGLNSSGQCGHPVLPSTKIDPERLGEDRIKTPTKISLPKSLLKGIAQFSAGVEHSLFLSSKTGFVYQCGGPGHKSSACQEVLINEPICKIEASLHSAALSFNGNLYLWSHENSTRPNTQIKNVKDISLSKDFAIIVDNSDKKFCWGEISK